jgi:catalase
MAKRIGFWSRVLFLASFPVVVLTSAFAGTPGKVQPTTQVSASSAGLATPLDVTHIPANQQPQDLVDALHTAFGRHHARAVHTKGVILVGSFTPAAEAKTICKAPIFTGGALPLVARYSLFAGVPNLPDNAGPASPSGLALKIKGADGNDYDLVTNQHNGFIVSNTDEFAVFLRAVGASGPGVAHPTPVEQFLSTRPISKAFTQSLTYPASYATATFFGINSFKFTNAQGKAIFVRSRLVPRAGEHYLKPDELKAKGENYLEDEIVARVGKGAVVYDWYVQVAESGDKIEDPSIAWPESRKLVKLGTFSIARLPDDASLADRTTLYLPGQPHPGIEPADPMLVLRNKAYPISFQGRQ